MTCSKQQAEQFTERPATAKERMAAWLADYEERVQLDRERREWVAITTDHGGES